MQDRPAQPRVAAIDWSAWQPTMRAVLLFVIRDGRILLIHKKQGLGAGKINGPGGRIEPGETPAQAAVREVQEELCITPADPQKAGELHFQFTDGLRLHCHVFTSNAFTGKPTETGEAIPLWYPLDSIPYDQMWQDDPYWLPLMLNGMPFRGYFVFDADRMLDLRIDAGAGARV